MLSGVKQASAVAECFRVLWGRGAGQLHRTVTFGFNPEDKEQLSQEIEKKKDAPWGPALMGAECVFKEGVSGGELPAVFCVSRPAFSVLPGQIFQQLLGFTKKEPDSN